MVGIVSQSFEPVISLSTTLILSLITKPIFEAPLPDNVLEKVSVNPTSIVSLIKFGEKESVPFTGVPLLSTTSMCVILELNPPRPFTVNNPSFTSTIIVSTTV